MDGAKRVVFMGLWIAEVDEDSVAEVLGNVSVQPLGDGAAYRMVRTYDLAKFLEIETLGQVRRSHEIAEDNGQLPPLAGRRAMGGWRCRCPVLARRSAFDRSRLRKS